MPVEHSEPVCRVQEEQAIKKLGWLIAGVVWALSVPAAVSGPICVSSTLAGYVALGSEGCDIGPLTFKRFEFEVQDSGGGYTPVGASGVNVSPFAFGNVVGLRFTSLGFQVSGDEYVRYLLSYIVDPPPVIIRGVEALPSCEPPGPCPPPPPEIWRLTTMMQVSSPQPPGEVNIGTDLWAMDYGHLSIFHHGNGDYDLTHSAIFVPPTQLVTVAHTIELMGNGASADFDALVVEVELVPEPATWLLGGCGLLMLLLRRRRAS